MKALFCGKCSTVQSPPEAGDWRHCPCGQSAVRWEDARAGRLEVWAVDLTMIRVLGLNNDMIYASYGDPVIGKARGNGDWRRLHRETCRDVPAEYMFNAAKRDCWAVLIAPGETGDIRWTTQRPWPGVGDHEPAAEGKEPAKGDGQFGLQ